MAKQRSDRTDRRRNRSARHRRRASMAVTGPETCRRTWSRFAGRQCTGLPTGGIGTRRSSGQANRGRRPGSPYADPRTPQQIPYSLRKRRYERVRTGQKSPSRNRNGWQSGWQSRLNLWRRRPLREVRLASRTETPGPRRSAFTICRSPHLAAIPPSFRPRKNGSDHGPPRQPGTTTDDAPAGALPASLSLTPTAPAVAWRCCMLASR